MGTEKVSRDEQNWAQPVDSLAASNVPQGALDTVGGKQVLSPIQGFGKMWQKTYRVSLAGTDVTPQEAIAVWKDEFPSFWPKGSQFHAPLTGITPGEVALLQASLGGGLKLSTGVLVHLRRRRVVHVHDAAGAHVRRLDHVQRVRAGRRDRRPGAGADAGAGSADRARADVRRPPQGGRVLAATLRALAERLGSRPSRRRPSSASNGGGSGRGPGTCGTRARSSRACTPQRRRFARRRTRSVACREWRTRSSSARARTAWLRRSRSRGRVSRCTSSSGRETLGGGMRTAELTLPGFKHDVCSAIHPLAVGSPFLRRSRSRSTASSGSSRRPRWPIRSTTARLRCSSARPRRPARRSARMPDATRG